VRRGGLAATLLVLAGCGESIEVVLLDRLTTPPGSSVVRDDRIDLEEGTALAIQLQAFTHPPNPDDSECCTDSCQQRCYDEAEDPEDVFAFVTGPADLVPLEDGRQFLIVGLGEGEGELVVSVDGASGEVVIPLRVTAQRSEP
jgi:hypothetical protein